MNEDSEPLTSKGADLITIAVGLWRGAQVLYGTPAWEGRPEARAISEEIAERHPECEDDLKRKFVENLPAELLARKASITISEGSFRTKMDLGGLARQIQKQCRARAIQVKNVDQ
jgi:hypothetical protein